MPIKAAVGEIQLYARMGWHPGYNGSDGNRLETMVR